MAASGSPLARPASGHPLTKGDGVFRLSGLQQRQARGRAISPSGTPSVTARCREEIASRAPFCDACASPRARHALAFSGSALVISFRTSDGFGEFAFAEQPLARVSLGSRTPGRGHALSGAGRFASAAWPAAAPACAARSYSPAAASRNPSRSMRSAQPHEDGGVGRIELTQALVGVDQFLLFAPTWRSARRPSPSGSWPRPPDLFPVQIGAGEVRLGAGGSAWRSSYRPRWPLRTTRPPDTAHPT